MTKDEALKLALEALSDERYVSRYSQIEEAIAAIKKALEEPQTTHSEDCYKWHHKCAIAMIERKKTWVELTAEEIWKCNMSNGELAHICSGHQNVLDFAEAIEAKLKEKNT
jgi:acyl-CoA reductase-like NAD-dependent aldehyde dehydrogenase